MCPVLYMYKINMCVMVFSGAGVWNQHSVWWCPLMYIYKIYIVCVCVQWCTCMKLTQCLKKSGGPHVQHYTDLLYAAQWQILLQKINYLLTCLLRLFLFQHTVKPRWFESWFFKTTGFFESDRQSRSYLLLYNVKILPIFRISIIRKIQFFE